MGIVFNLFGKKLCHKRKNKKYLPDRMENIKIICLDNNHLIYEIKASYSCSLCSLYIIGRQIENKSI